VIGNISIPACGSVRIPIGIDSRAENRASARPLRRSRAQRAFDERVELAQAQFIWQPPQRDSRLLKCGSDETEKKRVPFFSVDIDETSRVLQLSLNGHQVEFEGDARTFFRITAEVIHVLIEALFYERRFETLIAVVEESNQIVDPRTAKRVLEIDPHKLRLLILGRANHEVPALVVAMYERLACRSNLRREECGEFVEYRSLPFAQFHALGIERPFSKVVDLPPQQIKVERARIHDTPRWQLGEYSLSARDIGDRPLIQELTVFWVLLEVARKGVIAEVFDKNEPVVACLSQDPRHRDAPLVQEIAHLEKGPTPSVSVVLGDLVGPRAVRHKHRNGALAPRERNPEESPRRSSAGHLLDVQAGSSSTSTADQLLEHVEARIGVHPPITTAGDAGEVDRTRPWL
jgi:hypothetical protein